MTTSSYWTLRTHHRDQVHVSSAGPAPEERTTDSSSSENHNLYGVSVLCGETEGSGELVVKPARESGGSARAFDNAKENNSLVDVLVQTLVVKNAVRDVVPCVLHEEEESELRIVAGQEVSERHWLRDR